MIINLVRRSFQNTFLKVTGANGLISVAKAFLVIISNKVLAIVIGATGIAMIGQLQNFTTIITQISNGGFNQGLTKYIAENRDNKNEVKEFVGTAFRISFLLTSVTALFIILLSGFLSSRIFDTLEYNSILIIFAFTLFFYNLNSLILSIINGFQEYRKYFKINITTTVVGFVLTIGLVLLLKEYGALLAIVLSQSIVSIFAYFYIKKDYWLKAFSFKIFKKPKMFLLLKYSAITLLGTVIWPLVSIVIRTYVINNISAKEAGLWQAARYIDHYIVNIAAGSFSVYLLPKLASVTDSQSLKKELRSIYKVIIPISLACFILVFIFRDFVIILLYSKEFLKASQYLILQMIGSFFWLCKSPLMNFMLAKGMIKTFIANEMIFAVFVIILSIILIPWFEIQGIQFTYTLQSLLYLIVSIFLIKKYIAKMQIEESVNYKE